MIIVYTIMAIPKQLKIIKYGIPLFLKMSADYRSGSGKVLVF
jgi:hypothetical protein